MKYAFVFVGIVAIWIAGVLLVMARTEDVNLIYATIMGITVLLFVIGFKKGRR